MKLILILLLTINLTFSQQYWEYVPGVRNYVHSIFIPKDDSNIVVVAADSIPIDLSEKDIFPSFYALLQGSGLCISRDGGNTFSEYPTLDSALVLSIEESKIDPDLWVASISIKNEGQFAFSYDKGKTWEVGETECFGSEKILDIVSLEKKMLGGAVSTGRGFFSSEDDFKTCSNLQELNVSVRDIDIQDNVIWLASDNNANAGVYRSDDLGETWNADAQGLEALRIHSVDATGVYQEWGIVHCGADQQTGNENIGKGIYISRNNGLDWSLIGAENCIVYDIEHHPKYPLFMAAACGIDGIYYSSDGGITWEKKFNEGLPENADVRLIHIPDLEIQEDGFFMYAGVYNSGLYKSKNIMPELTSLENTNEIAEFDLISTYPNPASSRFTISLNVEFSKNYFYSLYSVTGKQVLSNSIDIPKGVNNINVDLPKNINDGVYLLSITDGKSSVTQKIIVRQKP